MQVPSAAPTQVARWRAPLAIITVGGLAFALVSGSLILFYGQSLARREYWGLVHWLLSGLVLIPYALYQLRHYLRVRPFVRQTHYRVGLHSFFLLCGTVLSGLPLIVPLEPGTTAYTALDLAHMFFGFVFVLLVSAHLTLVATLTLARVPAGERGSAEVAVRNFFAAASAVVAALLVVAMLA